MSAAMIQAFLALRAERGPALPDRRIRVRREEQVELLLGVVEPAGRDPADVLLFFHGAGGHMGAGYLDLARALHAQCGAAVLLPDLRGHGRSGGARGALADAQVLWSDLDALVQRARERYPRARLHLGGHSLGASLCLNWLCREAGSPGAQWRRQVSSLLLLAPYTGLPDLDRPLAEGHAAFITRETPTDATPEAICFGYSPEIARAAGLVRRYQPAMFQALVPQDFPAQLREVLQELRLPVTVLAAEGDELFDSARLHAVLRPLLTSGDLPRLRFGSVPGGHLSGLYFAAAALGEAIVAADVAGSPVLAAEGSAHHTPSPSPQE